MKGKDVKLLLLIVGILVLCISLRMTSNIEITQGPTDAYEEVEVERVNPTPNKKETKKKNKKTNNKKQTKKEEKKEEVSVVFEDIEPVDYTINEAIISITNSTPQTIEELPSNLKNPEDVYFCRLSILKALAYFDFPYCGKEECVLKEKVLEVLTKYIRENKPKVIRDKK
jgi:hypothetical protein